MKCLEGICKIFRRQLYNDDFHNSCNPLNHTLLRSELVFRRMKQSGTERFHAAFNSDFFYLNDIGPAERGG